MKKLLSILSMLLVGTWSFAQNAPIDFETGGKGATWTWNMFENGTNPALEFVDNPNPSGINTSAKVAKFSALAAGQPWAGTETAHGSPLGTFTLGPSNSIIKIMVYKNKISDVGIKLASNTGWALVEIKKANTLINQWEELTFDFSGYTNPPAGSGMYDQVIVFPDFIPNGTTRADNIIYFDNITFGAAAPVTEPTTAAPTPTRAAADVISMFSNAYTNVPVNTWRTDWSAATLTDLQVAGNDTKKYSGLDFVGIETTGANLINATTMTHLHMDVWTPNATSFGVKLVDFGANAAYQGSPNDDSEHQVNIASPQQGQWVSIDIPFTDFTGLTSRAHLAQMILVGVPSGSSTVYVDNVYFYKATAPVTEPTTAAPTPTRAGADVISMFSNAYTNVPVNTWRTDWSAATLTDLQVAGNDTKKYSGLDFVGIETTGANLINATTMTHLHMDVWTPNATSFGVKLVDFGANAAYQGSPNDDSEHQVNIASPQQGQWVSIDIPLTDFTGLTAKAHLAQMILVGAPSGSSTVFVDNVYFYKATVPVTEPTAGAPIPPRRLAQNVISMFSNAYTNVPVNTWRTDWSAATLTDLQVAGNDTKKYSGLDFVGIETTGANVINASAMTYLHLDIWTSNATSFGVKLVDFGANGAYQGSPNDDSEHQVNIASPQQGQWVSIDIPFTDFTGLTSRAHLAQMILVGVPSGSSTVYVDNVYFHNNITVSTDAEEVPQQSGLLGNYPNPFTQNTVFKYTLKEGAAVKFDIIDGLGRVVQSIDAGYQSAGQHELPVENAGLSSGIYFMRLQTSGQQFFHKFTVLR